MKRILAVILIALLIPSPAYGATKQHYKHTRLHKPAIGHYTIYKP